MTNVNLVAFENGVGNSRDIVLLKAALTELGCTVTVTVPSRHARRRRRLNLVRAFGAWRLKRSRAAPRAAGLPFDVTVMLEHVWPEEMHRARRLVIVPNPEFFDRHDRALLGAFDAVWAKTPNTAALFKAIGANPVLTGFDSADRYLAEGPRAPTFLHVAGKSRMKGTERLLEVWRRHPEWPLLTVVQSLPRKAPAIEAANVRLLTHFLDDRELKALQNQHGIHLCTSETEGWGHYIAEAASTGALVLATDAPPMNELVTPERALLVRAEARGRQHLATLYVSPPDALEATIEHAIALAPAVRAGLGAAARAWFLANKAEFPARLARALEGLATP